jgi:hypothetical protein
MQCPPADVIAEWAGFERGCQEGQYFHQLFIREAQ